MTKPDYGVNQTDGHDGPEETGCNVCGSAQGHTLTCPALGVVPVDLDLTGTPALSHAMGLACGELKLLTGGTGLGRKDLPTANTVVFYHDAEAGVLLPLKHGKVL